MGLIPPGMSKVERRIVSRLLRAIAQPVDAMTPKNPDVILRQLLSSRPHEAEMLIQRAALPGTVSDTRITLDRAKKVGARVANLTEMLRGIAGTGETGLKPDITRALLAERKKLSGQLSNLDLLSLGLRHMSEGSGLRPGHKFIKDALRTAGQVELEGGPLSFLLDE